METPPAAPPQPIYQRQAPYYAPPDYGEPPATPGLLGQLTLSRLLRILRKKWLTILLVLGFSCLGAALYLHFTPKVYSASSLIELSARRPRILTQQAAVIDEQGSGSSDEIFSTQLEKFKSPAILADAAERLRQKRPDLKLNADEFMNFFSDGINLSMVRKTRLLQITVAHTDPQLAANACNAFAEAAEASVYEEKRRTSDAAVDWLETQVVAQRHELEKMDNNLLQFRQDQKLDALERQRKVVEDSLLSFNKTLVEIESEVTRSKELLAALSNVDIKPETAGQLPVSVPRADEIKTAMEKWMSAVATRDVLMTRYTARHPEVELNEKMIALYRSQALGALERARTTVAATLALLGQQAEGLRRETARQGKLASDLELQIMEGKARLTGLERARDASDIAYRGLLTRIQEARMAADENTATAKIYGRAAIPRYPVKPIPVRIWMLALVLGLMAGAGLGLVKDNLEDRVTESHDIEAMAGAQVMALVPHVANLRRKDLATASLNNSFGQIAEAFAGLRSVLDSARYKNHSQVILVASSFPKEGKTITSCNLAIAFAKKGQRTLLVDFDLRRPQLIGIFPVPAGRRYLGDFLADEDANGEVTGLAYATACENLSVIVSQSNQDAHAAEKPVHAADLVGGKNTANLVAWARRNFDRVILDAPPLGLVSDAFVLSGLADCVLVMVRPEVSRKRALQQTLHRFRGVGGMEQVALVVNDVNFSKHYFSPLYHHYYGHYAGYDSEEEGPPEDAPPPPSEKNGRQKTES